MSNKSGMSTLLTVIGAIGVVATAVLTAKATPKAEKAILKAEIDKDTELTTWDKVKAAAPAYIPAVVVGVSTISCIFGANILNKQAQASLASAYAILDSSYKEFKRRVDEVYGEGSSAAIEDKLNSDGIDELNDDIEYEKEILFWDDTTMEHFTSQVTKVVTDDGLECYIISTPINLLEKLWIKGYC
jgi:hypothetical protein